MELSFYPYSTYDTMTILDQAINEFKRRHKKAPVEALIRPDAAVALVAMGERIPKSRDDIPVRIDDKVEKRSVGTGTRVLLTYGPLPGNRMAVTAHEA